MAESVNLGSAYATLELNTAGFNSAIAGVQATMSTMNKSVASVGTQVGALGTSFSNLGSKMMIPSLLVGAFGVKAVQTAMDVEVAWKEVAKVYDGTAEEITSSLMPAVDALTIKFGKNKLEVIATTSALAAMGYSGSELIDMVTQSLEFATTGTMDLATATEYVNAISKIYGVTGKDLRKTLALLNTVENSTSASMQDLGEAIAIAGQSGLAAGVDLNHFTAMVAALRERAIPAGEAANGLKTILTRLQGKDFAGHMKEIGIQTQLANGKLLSGTEILEKLAGKWDTLTEAQRLEIAQGAAGVFQKNKFLTLMSDISSESSTYTKTLGAIGDETANLTTYQKEMNIFLDTSKTKWAQFKAALQDFMVVLGATLGDTLMPLIGQLTDLFRKFADLPEPMKKATANLLLFTAAIGPLSKYVIGPLVSALGGLINIFAAFGTGGMAAGFAKLLAALGPIGTIIGWIGGLFSWLWSTVLVPIAAAIGAAITAIASFFAVPVAVVVAAIVAIIAAVVLLIVYWDEVKTFTINTWNAIVAFLKPLIEGIVTWFINAWNTIKNFFIGVWTSIYGFLQPFLYMFYEIFRLVFTLIAAFFILTWRALSTFFIGIWNGIVAFLTPIINAIVGFLVERWTTLKNNTIAVFNAVWGFISWVFNAIWSKVVGVASAIWGAISGPLNQIWTGIVDIFNRVKNSITGFLNDAWQWGANLINNFIDGIKSKATAVGNAAKGISDSIWKFLHQSYNPLTPAKRWGEHLIKNYAAGINAAIPQLETMMAGVNATISPGTVYTSSNGVVDNSTQTNNFNVSLGVYAGSPIEKRAIATELASALDDVRISKGQAPILTSGGLL